MSGMDLPLAVMITIPVPWKHDRYMWQEIKDFYRYYATMMEPWDGPASILFTDGEILGAEKYAAEGFDFYSAAPRFEYPIRSSSTSLAAFLPSRIAQTTSDWPRRISPAV